MTKTEIQARAWAIVERLDEVTSTLTKTKAVNALLLEALKCQDRDTRHACAEACLVHPCSYPQDLCMNVRAVNTEEGEC